MLDKNKAIRKDKVKSANSEYYVYYFNCLTCNKEIKSQSSQLKKHSGKCQRCCQLKEPYKFIYTELKNHRNRKVEFNLTFEEFKQIINNNKVCHYCSKLLIYNQHSRNWGESLTRAHQLDRKDNSKGYIKDNIVTCCWTCNRLKSDAFTYEEFMLLSPILKNIYEKRQSCTKHN